MGALVGYPVAIVEDAVHASAAVGTVQMQEFEGAECGAAELAMGKWTLAVGEPRRKHFAVVVVGFYF